jgi:hypothetical protein
MNYGQLKSILTRYLKRDDLTDLYDVWADLTSTRVDAGLELSEQEYRTITIPKAQFISLPGDFITMRHLEVNYAGGAPVEYVTAMQLDQMRIKYGTSGGIRFYTILNNQLELFPPPGPDSEQVLTMYYFAKLPALLQDADTNKVLESYPQLYIYGMMIEAAAFREHKGDSDTYAGLFSAYADSLNDKQSAGRYSGNGLTMRARIEPISRS